MPKPFTPKVITANDLLVGDVIYQTLSGWSRDLNDAEVLTDEAHAELRNIEAMQQINDVVGVYMIDIEQGESGIMTQHFREAFRAKGPSNYAHGKQESAQQEAR